MLITKVDNEYLVTAKYRDDVLRFSSKYTNTIDSLIENNYLSCDLMIGENADEVMKYENYDFSYITYFNIDDLKGKHFLSFTKIDTYGTILINDKVVASTHNGFIGYKFNIDDYIKLGENKLEIQLLNPISNRTTSKTDWGCFNTERIGVRRTQCTFGWDWVNRFISCGFYEPLIITYDENELILDNVYIRTYDISAQSAKINIIFDDVECCFERYELNVVLFDEDKKEILSKNIVLSKDNKQFDFIIKNPHLWFPIGYGKQPLYLLKIYQNGNVIYSDDFGIRKIEIKEEKDEKGSKEYNKCLEIKNSFVKSDEFASFTLFVNGIKIFCQGANWVPCEPYITADYGQKALDILQLSINAGVNTIRVWAGGHFESKEFYRACSKLGVLVIQDFLLACGDYPETEQWFLAELAVESEYICKLIRNEPSLIWYQGNNELCVEGSDLLTDYKGKSAFYNGSIAGHKFDKDRRFLPASPYGGDSFGSNVAGTTHNTANLSKLFDYSNNASLDDYKEHFKKYLARFISEECQYGASSYSSLKRFMSEDEIFGCDLSMWEYHSKSNPFMEKSLFQYLNIFAEKILGPFIDGKDRLFKLEYMGYEWVRITFELARRESDFCSGLLYWMLNDCWAASSGWALIDYYNKPKLSYYAFKNCAQPIVCSIDNNDGKYNLYISNIRVSDYNVNAKVYLCDDSSRMELVNFNIASYANSTQTIDLGNYKEEGKYLVAQINCGEIRSSSFYKDGNLHLIEVFDAVEFVNDEQYCTLYITAKKNLQCVYMDGDYVFDDNGFLMLEGEQRAIKYKKTKYCLEDKITFKTYKIK